jgi:hypothetical protein
VPTVRERVVQQACKIVIEPIFDANFQDASDGFRPKRRAGQAVKVVKEARVSGGSVVDADIESYLDTIDHDVLMGLIRTPEQRPEGTEALAPMVAGRRDGRRPVERDDDRGTPGGGGQPADGHYLRARVG